MALSSGPLRSCARAAPRLWQAALRPRRAAPRPWRAAPRPWWAAPRPGGHGYPVALNSRVFQPGRPGVTPSDDETVTSVRASRRRTFAQAAAQRFVASISQESVPGTSRHALRHHRLRRCAARPATQFTILLQNSTESHLRPLTDSISNSTAPHKHTNTAQATEREPHTHTHTRTHTQDTDRDRESTRGAVRTAKLA